MQILHQSSHHSLPSLKIGITLIETLIVIAIVGLLVTITLPAVQMVRSASRANQCRNNLHNVGLATQSFVIAKKHLPNISAMKMLAPYLELQTVDKSNLFNGVSPKILQCPDEIPSPWYENFISYFLNDGASIFPRNGIGNAYEEQGVTLSEISDGLSNTALFGERITRYSIQPEQTDDEARRFPFRFAWLCPTVFEPGQEQQFSELSRSSQLRKSAIRMGTYGFDNFSSTAYYDHIAPPNNWMFRNGDGPDGATRSLHPASSFHSGGVHVLYCDGSVHFTGSSVDEDVWRQIGSKNGR